MYYMYQPNQNYFNGEMPAYKQYNPYEQDLLRNRQTPQTSFGSTGYNELPWDPNDNGRPYQSMFQPVYQNPYQNNGYMNNMGTYYNPYAQRYDYYQQQQQQQAYEKSVFDGLRLLTKISSNALGQHLSDAELDQATYKKFYPQYYQSEEIDNRTESEKLEEQIMQENYRQHYTQVISVNTPSMESIAFANHINQIQSAYKVNECKDLYDWCTLFDEMEEKRRQREAMIRSRDMSVAYDNNKFHQYFNDNRYIEGRPYAQSVPAVFKPDPSIDDMTVELPTHLRNQYAERRKAFVEQLLAKNRGGC